jgi:hypothetical protein
VEIKALPIFYLTFIVVLFPGLSIFLQIYRDSIIKFHYFIIKQRGRVIVFNATFNNSINHTVAQKTNDIQK